jgi:hypothetical protein
LIKLVFTIRRREGMTRDERRFIDLPSSPIWLGEENVVIDGP